jgi:Cu-Zn family superoxide dismutase
MKLCCLVVGALFAGSTTIAAAQTQTADIEVNLISASGAGASAGTIHLRDTHQGLLIEPNLRGLPPGIHGFHVHEKTSCAPAMNNGQMTAGFGAGGHYDPKRTGKHRGPDATDGHLGDLPVLLVDADGRTTLPLLAPHLRVHTVLGRSVVIHAGGDNYLDDPAPLGGGGARIACGIVNEGVRAGNTPRRR